MLSYTKGTILIIILLFLITFGVRNSHPVQLNYYFNIPSINVPLYGLAYISVIIGIFIGMLIGISRRLSLHKTVKALERENRELEKKVTEEKKEEEE